jgi:hypothetical protein
MWRPSRSSRRGKCDAIPEGQEPRAGKLLQLRGLASWWFESGCFPVTIQKPITLQEAKSTALHLGLTLRKVRSGHYGVNFRDGDESTACYAVDLEDAVNAAVAMARKREL